MTVSLQLSSWSQSLRVDQSHIGNQRQHTPTPKPTPLAHAFALVRPLVMSNPSLAGSRPCLSENCVPASHSQPGLVD